MVDTALDAQTAVAPPLPPPPSQIKNEKEQAKQAMACAINNKLRPTKVLLLLSFLLLPPTSKKKTNRLVLSRSPNPDTPTLTLLPRGHRSLSLLSLLKNSSGGTRSFPRPSKALKDADATHTRSRSM